MVAVSIERTALLIVKQPSPELVEQMLRDALSREDESEVHRLSRLLDELCKPRGPIPLGAAALWYAEQGLRVFPIMPMQKTPYPRTHGLHDATSDVEQVRAWWAARPDSNIGIATGHIVNVVDIDGFKGNVSLAHLLAEHPTMLSKCVGKVSTPRPGGRHFYMPAKSYGNGAALADGIDYRGVGGYVLAPPSRTELGRYVWTTALDVDAARSRADAS